MIDDACTNMYKHVQTCTNMDTNMDKHVQICTNIALKAPPLLMSVVLTSSIYIYLQGESVLVSMLFPVHVLLISIVINLQNANSPD